MKWVNNHIEIDPPKKCKKITGTRLAAILNYNKWSTPFQAWCEITKTYEKPFEDTKYTIAGKVIEPKQAEYLKEHFFANIVTPTDVFGSDYFKKTYGDFYKENPIFGGMWDFLMLDYFGTEIDRVIECKTTQRAEDWQDKPPLNYLLQVCLYSYLKGINKNTLICSFLNESDYEHPELFVPNETNTIVREFETEDYFPDFEEQIIKPAIEFWKNHVMTGISPDYDEKLDADYLKELRKNNINPTTQIEELISEYEQLDSEINEVISQVADKAKRLDVVKSQIKEYLCENLRDGDKQCTCKGKKYEFIVTYSETRGIDKDKLKQDGLYSHYEKVTVSQKFTTKELKGE